MLLIASNAPEGYVCPICVGLQGADGSQTLIKPSDFVYRDELVSAFVNSFFMGRNAGHVIIVPNAHYENIYTLPSAEGHRIFDIAQKVSLAMKKAYGCDGITTRNNNEPAGDQHAFHFHFHIFPRYHNDGYNGVAPADKRLAAPEERARYAIRMRNVLNR